MNTTFHISISKKPFLFGVIVFVMVLVLTQYLSYLKYTISVDATRSDALQEVNAVEERLRTALRYNLSAAKTLAFIIERYGVPDDFNTVAKEILGSNKNIDLIEITRRGIITHVYPKEGNQSIIGYDILKDSLTNKEANKTIKKSELFFAGPFELKQGGIAIVGRLPIFKENEFWGFSVVIVKLPTLLKAAGIEASENSRFIYQLSKINPNNKRETFFLPRSPEFNKTRSFSIKIPDGEWNVYVMPKKDNNLAAIVFSFIGLMLSIICGLFAFYLAKQPEKLNQLVNEKTTALNAMQNNLENILERVSDAIVALDRDWRYTFLNDAALAQHPFGKQETIGKIIWDVHPEIKETIFWDKYHEAMQTNKVVEVEGFYAPMDSWFSVKVYPSVNGMTLFYKDITKNKKAEDQVLREKRFSESIVNSLPGIFYLYDRNGKFLQWNKNFEIISGYSAGEISQMHPLDFFPENEKDLVSGKIDEVFVKGMSEVEAHFYTRKKEKIPYYFNGHMANLDGTDYLLGVGIDITERKKAGNALKESEEKYRYLFNNNPAFIIIWDIESFAILEVNDVALEQYGYTRDAFLSLSVLELRPEEDRELLRDFSKKILTSNEDTARKIWRHLKKNGEIMYMDISSHRIDYGSRKAILSLAKDITEQVAAENQLKETYEDIRRLNAHLQTVREEERISIAREIHDELGQQLTGLKMDAVWLTRKVAAEEKDKQERLAGMIGLIDETVKTIRRISSDLRPAILDDLGLIAALEWQSTEFEKRTGIRCNFITHLTEIDLDKSIISGVFRIYQETLTNVMRHAKATTVSTAIEQTGDFFMLSVKDNGKGFDTIHVKDKKTLGFTGMRERALMFNGQLNIESEKGRGTIVNLKIPITLYPTKT